MWTGPRLSWPKSELKNLSCQDWRLCNPDPNSQLPLEAPGSQYLSAGGLAVMFAHPYPLHSQQNVMLQSEHLE